MGRIRGRNNRGGVVIFGRKRTQAPDGDEETPELSVAPIDGEEAVEQETSGPQDPEDWRIDGPFDIDEVDLGTEVPRIDLETVVITPWDGLNLQLQVDEQSRRVLAATGVWADSGLELVLFAAPARGGLAEELRVAAAAEAEELGGTVEIADGPFGPEIRRVLPHTGPQGEQLYHVSRVWFAEGPRWLLRGTLLGEAALDAEDLTKAAPFVEFFRNVVVRRGDQPMVPGDRITMRLPEGAS